MCKKDNCCQKSDCCGSVGYGEVLRLQTCADLSCVLCLVTSLESALSEDSVASPALTVPSLNVKLAAQNLREFLNEHTSTLPAIDGTGVQNANESLIYGAYTYLDCVCKKLPLLWRECDVTYGEGGASRASIFDLALDTPTVAYGTVNAQAFLEAVCCLKRHYQLLKSVLNCC